MNVTLLSSPQGQYSQSNMETLDPSIRLCKLIRWQVSTGDLPTQNSLSCLHAWRCYQTTVMAPSHTSTYAWLMPVLMPELCQYLRLTNVSSYAWLMPILTPDLCQYVYFYYVNTYARLMPVSASIYTWNMPILTPGFMSICIPEVCQH